MTDMYDFHAFQSTGGGSGSGSSGGKDFGCSWIVIVIVALLLFFIADGTSWDTIDSLLGFGLLAFLFRWISTQEGGSQWYTLRAFSPCKQVVVHFGVLPQIEYS